MLIDTHSHLNFAAFRDDLKEVIARCRKDDIWIINVGTKYETSQKAVELAQKYKEGIFAAIGLHPNHLETGLVKIKNDPAELSSVTSRAGKEEIEIKISQESFDYEKYKELVQAPKVVAIGEIGLDYYWKPKTKIKLKLFKERQRVALRQQLALAKEVNLPVIFHCRLAHEDLINELRIGNYGLLGVIHCFTGNWQQAQEFLEMGFYLGFNGLIFKLNFEEVIKKTPLDKILLETDCPYLTPPPGVLDECSSFRNSQNSEMKTCSSSKTEGRNEPLYVKYIAEKIAQIKNLSFEEIAEITSQNAKKLFKIES